MEENDLSTLSLFHQHFPGTWLFFCFTMGLEHKGHKLMRTPLEQRYV